MLYRVPSFHHAGEPRCHLKLGTCLDSDLDFTTILHSLLLVMASLQAPSPALLRSLKALAIGSRPTRTLSSTNWSSQQVQTTTTEPVPDPATVVTRKEEWELFKSGTPPIGSRRRRAAQAQTSNIPFDELPYQCFQEARKVLIADRAVKLKQIEKERGRIARLQETDSSTIPGGEMQKQRRLRGMQKQLEDLKILADINDPNVKRRFEDGQGKVLSQIHQPF